MWAYGRYFLVHSIDHKMKQCDSRIDGEISRGWKEVHYIGLVMNVVQVEYSSSLGETNDNKIVLFQVQWYKITCVEMTVYFMLWTQQN